MAMQGKRLSEAMIDPGGYVLSCERSQWVWFVAIPLIVTFNCIRDLPRLDL